MFPFVVSDVKVPTPDEATETVHADRFWSDVENSILSHGYSSGNTYNKSVLENRLTDTPKMWEM
jgi:hypothetical protein